MVAGFELHVSMTVILPFAPPHGLHTKPRRRTLRHDIQHGGVNLVAREGNYKVRVRRKNLQCRNKDHVIIELSVSALSVKFHLAYARKKEYRWIATTTCSKSFPTAHPSGDVPSRATKTQFSNCANSPSTLTTKFASCTLRPTQSSLSSTPLTTATKHPGPKTDPQKAPEIFRRRRAYHFAATWNYST